MGRWLAGRLGSVFVKGVGLICFLCVATLFTAKWSTKTARRCSGCRTWMTTRSTILTSPKEILLIVNNMLWSLSNSPCIILSALRGRAGRSELLYCAFFVPQVPGGVPSSSRFDGVPLLFRLVGASVRYPNISTQLRGLVHNLVSDLFLPVGGAELPPLFANHHHNNANTRKHQARCSPLPRSADQRSKRARAKVIPHKPAHTQAHTQT